MFFWAVWNLSSVLLKARPTDLMSLQPRVHPGWAMVWREGSHVSRTVSNRKWNTTLETGVWRFGSSQNSDCGTIPPESGYLKLLSHEGGKLERLSYKELLLFNRSRLYAFCPWCLHSLSLSIMGNRVSPSFVGPSDPVLKTNSFWIEFQTLRKCKDLIFEGVEHYDSPCRSSYTGSRESINFPFPSHR